MRREPQGHSIPMNFDVGMMVPLLSQSGDPIHPSHGCWEIRKNLSSDPRVTFQSPSRHQRWLVPVYRFHCVLTVRTNASGSSSRLKKFLAKLWEQQSKAMPTRAQQTAFQTLARVVAKMIHSRKIFLRPCLTGFAMVVRFVHRPY